MPKFELKELLTLPPKILAALAIATGLVLFLPSSIINKLYLEQFKLEYGFVLGITFTISLSILLCTLVVFILKLLYSNWSSKRKLAQYRKNLVSLNLYEKSIILALFKAPDNTLELPINKGITIKLNNLNIISRAATQAIVYGYDSSEWKFPYFLQPWVTEYIQENPHYLEDGVS